MNFQAAGNKVVEFDRVCYLVPLLFNRETK